MVVTSDGQKINLGLSLKFEMKRLKVIGYSRKDGRNWEFSDVAIQLILDYKVTRKRFQPVAPKVDRILSISLCFQRSFCASMMVETVGDVDLSNFVILN
jgi:hypothetical protein